jgi:hypothetical protein
MLGDRNHTLERIQSSTLLLKTELQRLIMSKADARSVLQTLTAHGATSAQDLRSLALGPCVKELERCQTLHSDAQAQKGWRGVVRTWRTSKTVRAAQKQIKQVTQSLDQDERKATLASGLNQRAAAYDKKRATTQTTIDHCADSIQKLETSITQLKAVQRSIRQNRWVGEDTDVLVLTICEAAEAGQFVRAATVASKLTWQKLPSDEQYESWQPVNCSKPPAAVQLDCGLPITSPALRPLPQN